VLILVAFYDTHELWCSYSLLPATTRGTHPLYSFKFMGDFIGTIKNCPHMTEVRNSNSVLREVLYELRERGRVARLCYSDIHLVYFSL
jgi:uncharacterized protein (DUF2126 family)